MIVVSISVPSGGVKKLKKESLGTVLVIVLTVPRPLCFCFFLIVFNVTFLPFVHSIVELAVAGGGKQNVGLKPPK